MRIFNKFRGTKGFISTWERVLRFRYMIQEKAKERVRILAFWERHGTAATEEAFKVKKRTLYRWQKKLKERLGKLEALNDGNRAPKQKRKRLWDHSLIEELRRLRNEHPNLGKEKLYPLLVPFCAALHLSCPKPRTIGRLVKDLGGLRVYPQKVTGTGRIVKANRQKVLRKPKDFKTTHAGHLVALDTIERFVHGMRRYIITFEDIHTRFGFAWATSSHASLAAKEFFGLCRKVFPHPIDFVLTDNGSEFKKHFAAELKRLHLIHYHTYPKTPKQNAHCERFNRTVQEEFVDFHANLLLDTASFNRKLMDYLAFYNTERVHFAFQNKLSPVAFMLSLPRYQLIGDQKCKTGWPYTRACAFTPPRYNKRVRVNFNTMNKEQPKSDPALDAALERAKAEEQMRKESEGKFSLSDLVESINNDGEKATAEKSNEAEAREERIREELKPLLGKLSELQDLHDGVESVDVGAMEYYALKGDKENWLKILPKEDARRQKIDEMWEQIQAEYEAKGGSQKLTKAFPELTNNKYAHIYKYGKKPDYTAEQKSKATDERYEAYRNYANITERMGRFTSQSAASYAPFKLEGIGITALKSGDLGIAAKVFVNMEKENPLRPELGQQIKKIVSEFNDEQRREFAKLCKETVAKWQD